MGSQKLCPCVYYNYVHLEASNLQNHEHTFNEDKRRKKKDSIAWDVNDSQTLEWEKWIPDGYMKIVLQVSPQMCRATQWAATQATAFSPLPLPLWISPIFYVACLF